MTYELTGNAELEPQTPVVAGSHGTWRIRYRVGKLGMNDGARIKLAIRWASDWGVPQFRDPRAPDYVTAATDGRASLRLSFDKKGHIRPWQRTIVLDVYDGYLKEGESVTITIGDRSGGSPGSRAQTFSEREFKFKALVDCLGTGNAVELPLGGFEITSGAPAALKVIVPSACGRGDRIAVLVKSEDLWGNPCARFRGTVELEPPPAVTGLPRSYEFTESDRGVHRFTEIEVREAGVHTIRARDAVHGLEAQSNPLACSEARPPHLPYWGDLQGQSEEDIGSNPLEDFFAFARDKAPLDFVSHQPNDFNVSDEAWERMKHITARFHAPGRFIPFLGMEWSATSAAGGDHNLIYLEDDAELHRSSRWQIGGGSADSDCATLPQLRDRLKDSKVIAIPHVGGRRAPMSFIDPGLIPLVEVYSCWGTFEWVIDDVLNRGFRVGFVANSDGHSGRPGAEYPGASDHFGVKGGLTCAYAEELTKEALWEALRNRRTYATTGERIILSFTADGHWMGEEYAGARPPKLAAQVTGTCDLEDVLLMRGDELIYQHARATLPEEPSDTLRISWGGARGIDRNKTTIWDGQLRVSGARIVAARSYSMDTPVKTISLADPHTVAWSSTTVGDSDGVEIVFSPEREAFLRFESEPVSFSLPLVEATVQPKVIDAGGVRQRVTVQRLRKNGLGRTTAFQHTDWDVRPGWNAYYLKAIQADGNMAWSSPAFVLYQP